MMAKTLPFIITSKCKRNCLYCFKTPIKDISYKDFKVMLDNSIKNNPLVKKIVLTGGDPVLNEDFFKMCEYVKKRGLKLKVIGTYEKDDDLDKYVSFADELSIPLDSLNSKVNDSLRGKGACKNSLNAINFFMKKDVKIQIHTVVNTKNLNAIDELSDWFENMNFFQNNSWKLFRFIKYKNNPDFSITDKEWRRIKEKKKRNKILVVDNVLEY